MSHLHGNESPSIVPPPGPLVAVDFAEPRAGEILKNVRQRVAMWGDAGRAITRAVDAVQTADRLIGAGPGAMGAEFRPVGRRVLRLNEIADGEPLWIVGDVRGDVLALETALGFIEEATAKGQAPQIVFLGDLTGGSAGDAACIAIALERFAAAPTRTIVIAGDRELSLGSAVTDERTPRSLAEMPVPPAQQKPLQNLIRGFGELAGKFPVAVICPGGLLLAHSSPPRESTLSDLKNAEALEARPEVLRTFAFNRLHAREPRVAPPAHSSEAAAEAEPFAESMLGLTRVLGTTVERMVRGQDAAPEGHRWFRNYGEGVLLTVSTLADALPGELGGGRRRPCVARLKSGRIRVVRFEIPEEISITAEQIFPRRSAEPVKTISSPPASAPPPLAAPPPKPPPAPARTPDVQAEQIHFERGVRLLDARAWPGARQAFQEAAETAADPGACQMNEGVACVLMGLPGHQDALRLFRGLLQGDAEDPNVHFNMGVSYLTNERNPIEAGRAFRTATRLMPKFEDAWWGLGLTGSLRGERGNAADAFAKAAESGCQLPAPSSLEGIIPARELNSAFDALRGRLRYHPNMASPPVPLAKM